MASTAMHDGPCRGSLPVPSRCCWVSTNVIYFYFVHLLLCGSFVVGRTSYSPCGPTRWLGTSLFVCFLSAPSRRWSPFSWLEALAIHSMRCNSTAARVGSPCGFSCHAGGCVLSFLLGILNVSCTAEAKSFIRPQTKRIIVIIQGACVRAYLYSFSMICAPQSWIAPGVAAPVAAGTLPRCSTSRRPWTCCRSFLGLHDHASRALSIGREHR